jgi:hypothetical protein
MRECQSYSDRFVYALSDVGQNTKQDVELLNQFERLTPVSIAFNEKKIIFENNLFEDNVGLMGGAINIESPNMRNVTEKVDNPIAKKNLYKLLDMESRPYTFIHNNTFTRNMAYLSGGSIFVRSTRMGDDKNRADELCGIMNL